ncbi:hypothetical protein [Brevundimonas sp. FT23042]|uniref:hypothetical protein n=1 Tax=Brevundimonas sp. FT23042 TaxID=3393749 RepID=UPI003B589FED
MTVISVTALEGRLSLSQRRLLSQTLTDAVLVPEVGQLAPPARMGFQVQFVERARDFIAIGGALVEDRTVDPILVDILVMDAAWPRQVRASVIANIFEALTAALDQSAPSSEWWVTFRVLEDGSWGSRAAPLSILDLLDTGVFTPTRVAEIRAALEAR